MELGRPRTRTPGIVRLLVALLFTLATTIPLSIATEHPALAADCNNPGHNTVTHTWIVPYGCPAVKIPEAHKCQLFNLNTVTLLNPLGGVEQVVQCVNVYAMNTAGHQEVWGEGDFYCQQAVVECQGMNVNVDFKYTDNPTFGSVTVPQRNYKCNGTGCPYGGQSNPAKVSTQHSPGDGYNYGFLAETWEPVDNVISVGGIVDHNLVGLDSGQVVVDFANP